MNEKILNQSKEERILNATIQSFFTNKKELDEYKKITDEENKEIKELMQQLNKSEYITDEGIIAKMIISTKETFNEPALMEKLKELGAEAAIELVPQINWDIIEDMIYNGKLNAVELAPFKEEKEVVTLRVSKKKGE